MNKNIFFLIAVGILLIGIVSPDIYSEDNLYGQPITNITYTSITNYINSTAWERSGINVFLTNINDKVGIGTDSPETKLHVKGVIHVTDPSLTRYFIEVFSSGGFGYIDSYDSTGNDYQDLVIRADDFIFEGEGTERFRITDSGNVGIGTITPSHKLNVIGDLNVTGTIINNAIYCESSELNDQTFAVAGVRYRLNISNVDEGFGISMATGNNGTNITIDVSGVYHLVAQPQVKAGAGGAGDFHMWIEKFNSTGWADVPDSNIELKLSSLEEDVIVLATTLKLNQGEKLRLVASVSDNKILLHAQTPSGEPTIPSIIFTMYRVGN